MSRCPVVVLRTPGFTGRTRCREGREEQGQGRANFRVRLPGISGSIIYPGPLRQERRDGVTVLVYSPRWGIVS